MPKDLKKYKYTLLYLCDCGEQHVIVKGFEKEISIKEQEEMFDELVSEFIDAHRDKTFENNKLVFEVLTPEGQVKNLPLEVTHKFKDIPLITPEPEEEPFMNTGNKPGMTFEEIKNRTGMRIAELQGTVKEFNRTIEEMTLKMKNASVEMKALKALLKAAEGIQEKDKKKTLESQFEKPKEEKGAK